MTKLIICFLIFALPILLICQEEQTVYKLGTGSETGIYYRVGEGLASADVEPVVTEGSVENIDKTMQGVFGFGIVQSDRQYQAYFGLEDWQDAGGQAKLRSICSLYPEAITLMASEDSGIQSVYNLKNKRINLGEKGSGQHQNALDVLTIIGCELTDIQPYYLGPQAAAEALQNGEIDAFFYTIGHPNQLVMLLCEKDTKIRFVPIVGYDAEKLLMDYPYYSKAVIPKEFYPKSLNEEDVESIGVRATLVTSRDIPDEVVRQLTERIFEHFDRFISIHPALRNLKKSEMFQSLSAPIHPGAIEYYRECGLIDSISGHLLQ